MNPHESEFLFARKEAHASKAGEESIVKKKIVTCITIVLILCIYGVMFGFSAQNGEQSGDLSFLVSRQLVRFADFFSMDTWTAEEMNTRAEQIDFLIRKAAHFSEYAALGFLEFGLAVMWMKPGKRRVCLIVGILLFSGGLDEFHQMFVPGRYPSFWDVLLDTAGGLSGMALLSFINLVALGRKQTAGNTGS